jgi:Tfp pilus assembly PilM family ATPase
MSIWSRWLADAPLPETAVEIAADHVSAVRLTLRRDGAVVTAHATEPLPDGVVRPALTGANVLDRGAVTAAVSKALDRIGRPRRVGLVVPDRLAQVSVISFESIPPRVAEFEELVRWRSRKTVPFPIEDAQVTFAMGERTATGQDVVVTIARREGVAEYEDLCTAAGAYAGLVGLATLNVANAALMSPAGPMGDWMLVHAGRSFVSVAVLTGDHVRLFRAQDAGGDPVGTIVHQAAMYYADRLGGRVLERVICVGSTPDTQGAVAQAGLGLELERRLARPVQVLDLGQTVALTDQISGAAAVLGGLSPLVGLLARGRRAA